MTTVTNDSTYVCTVVIYCRPVRLSLSFDSSFPILLDHHYYNIHIVLLYLISFPFLWDRWYYMFLLVPFFIPHKQKTRCQSDTEWWFDDSLSHNISNVLYRMGMWKREGELCVFYYYYSTTQLVSNSRTGNNRMKIESNRSHSTYYTVSIYSTLLYCLLVLQCQYVIHSLQYVLYNQTVRFTFHPHRIEWVSLFWCWDGTRCVCFIFAFLCVYCVVVVFCFLCRRIIIGTVPLFVCQVVLGVGVGRGSWYVWWWSVSCFFECM